MRKVRRAMEQEVAAITRRLAERRPAGILCSDDADRAVAGELQELDAAARDRMIARATELRSALARMDAGTYGRCDLCSEPIGDARLKALPAVAFCRACAEQIEREAVAPRAYGIERERRPARQRTDDELERHGVARRRA